MRNLGNRSMRGIEVCSMRNLDDRSVRGIEVCSMRKLDDNSVSWGPNMVQVEVQVCNLAWQSILEVYPANPTPLRICGATQLPAESKGLESPKVAITLSPKLIF